MRRLLSLAIVLAAVASTACAGTIKNMRELPDDAVVPMPSVGLIRFRRQLDYATASSRAALS